MGTYDRYDIISLQHRHFPPCRKSLISKELRYFILEHLSTSEHIIPSIPTSNHQSRRRPCMDFILELMRSISSSGLHSFGTLRETTSSSHVIFSRLSQGRFVSDASLTLIKLAKDCECLENVRETAC